MRQFNIATRLRLPFRFVAALYVAALVALLANRSEAQTSPHVPLKYFGGPVLGNVKIAPIYYGQGWTSDQMLSVQGYIAAFAQYISGVNAPSNEQPLTKQYGVVNAAVNDGRWFGTTVPAGAISTTDVVNIIHQAQAASVAPPYGPNTLILLLLYPGFFISDLGGGSSYHGAESPTQVYAAVAMPPLDGDIGVISHEIEEAVTDPGASSWTAPASNGLPDLGDEMADVCTVGGKYSWSGTSYVIPTAVEVSKFQTSVADTGGADNTSNGNCVTNAYTSTLAVGAANKARGAGHLVGTGSASSNGLFRATSGPLPNNGLDIANSGWVDVLTSNGASFNYSQWWPGPFYGAYGTLLGDLDDDGNADLVGLGSGYVGVIKGNGVGFGPYQTWSFSTFSGQFGNFLGDVDGDAKADLVALGNGYIGVLRSTGTGFGPYETFSSVTFNGQYGNFLADVDGDGKADLIGLGNGYVGVLRSAGKPCAAGKTCSGGGFVNYQQWFNATFNGAHGNAVGDVNGDGFADVVGFGDGYVGVLLSNGTSSFAYQQWSTDTVSGTYPGMLTDVNNDGKADIVLMTGTSVTVRLSTPAGVGVMGTGFGAAQTWYNGGF